MQHGPRTPSFRKVELGRKVMLVVDHHRSAQLAHKRQPQHVRGIREVHDDLWRAWEPATGPPYVPKAGTDLPSVAERPPALGRLGKAMDAHARDGLLSELP